MCVTCLTRVDAVWASGVVLWSVCGMVFLRGAGVSAIEWLNSRGALGVAMLRAGSVARAAVGRKNGH